MRLLTPRNNRGFTLIELMIVVVIIGILAALAIPRFGAASRAAKQSEAEPILKQMFTMQQAYYARHSSFTANFANLRDIGWEDPVALKHFTLPIGLTAGGTGAQSTFIATLNAATSDLKAACIDETGTPVLGTGQSACTP